MGKPFHELTDIERAALGASGMTFAQAAEEHPQPEWCDYPDAVSTLGCWSLTGGKVTGIDYCKNCDCLRSNAALTGAEGVRVEGTVMQED